AERGHSAKRLACPVSANTDRTERTNHAAIRSPYRRARAAAAQRGRRPWISIPRNAIADGANSAAPFAPGQGHPLGIGDKVGATVSNRANADGLTYEECRGLRRKRKHRSRECERK